MGGGYDRVGAHMGILGDKAADVVAKNAAEKVKALEDYEKWMSGGGYTAVGEEEWVSERDGNAG